MESFTPSWSVGLLNISYELLFKFLLKERGIRVWRMLLMLPQGMLQPGHGLRQVLEATGEAAAE